MGKSTEKKMIIMVGIPGSGKTTKRNEIIKQFGEGAVYTNMDELRVKYADKRTKSNRNEFEKFISAEEKKLIDQYLSEGHPLVIIDDTHLSIKGIETLERKAAEYGYVAHAEFLMDSFDIPKCHKRNTDRAHSQHVPAWVVETMGERFVGAWFAYHNRGVVLKNNRAKAIIVDLDGTAAHMNGRGAFDWKRVGEDTVDEIVRDLVRYYKSTGHVVIALSGRDGVCEPETRQWLIDNEIPFDHLWMRTPNDMRKDIYVKLELYVSHIMKKYDVKVCLDDRNQIVMAWRGIGLKCLQVGSGYF